MIAQMFATKQKMTQAWTKSGKRLAVTCVSADHNAVVSQMLDAEQKPTSFEIGYGTKKLKNMTKPLRSKLEKSGFSFGVKYLSQVKAGIDEALKPGEVIKVQDVLQVGDVVKVQGTTKGRGFAGAMKRHNFKGGPKTHGQSDRARAVGAIGQRTTPGRVFKGKKMPGHYGVDTQTVIGLVVLHIDPSTQQVWLSGPIPGSINSTVRISKTGQQKMIEIDEKASNFPTIVQPVEAAPEAEAQPTEVVELTPAVAEGATV